jgi:hypothetical protein
MEVNEQLNSPAGLSPGRTPLFIKQETGRAPEPVWTFRRGEKSLVPTGIQNPNPPAWCLAKTLTTLPPHVQNFNTVLYFHKIFKRCPAYTAKLWLVQILMISCPRIYSSNLIKHKLKVHPRLSVFWWSLRTDALRLANRLSNGTQDIK